MADTQVTMFACPDCGLVMSRIRTVRQNFTWSSWECWDCGHTFGGFGETGSLDIGIVREPLDATNRTAIFDEPFEGIERLYLSATDDLT